MTDAHAASEVAHSNQSSAKGKERSSALLNGSLAKYRTELEQSRETAQDRYGFTLYHSLTPAEKVLHLEQIGFESIGGHDATDEYNLGCAKALQGNFDAAIAHFERALADEPKWADAVHNLALTLEKAGRLEEAKAHWKKCLDLVADSEGRAKIQAHLGELG